MKRDAGLLDGELLAGFPRRYAGASLKHIHEFAAGSRPLCFPRRYAGASLKLGVPVELTTKVRKFSPALCRGLIEASIVRRRLEQRPLFSPALCRGLIEACRPCCR